MIDFTHIILTFAQIANADWGMLVDVTPYKKYVNNEPTKEIEGYNYVTVLPDNGYEKVKIKVAQAVPLFTKEDIAKNGGTIKIKPVGFQGKPYRISGGSYDVSCKATGIEVVK